MNPFGKKKLITGPEGSVEPQSMTDFMVQLAKIKELDLVKLERLISLKNEEDARLCEKEYSAHFALMQAEFPIIPRVKKGSVGTYKYAPLEVMVSLCRPVIAKHGFAYSWDQAEVAGEADRVMVTLTIKGYGHKERHSMKMFVEKPGKNKYGDDVTSRNQQMGSTDSYGHRYTFKSGFGLVEEGEDNDAAPPRRETAMSIYESSKGTVEDAQVEREEATTGRTLAQAYTEAARCVSVLQNKKIQPTLGSIMNRCRDNLANLEIFITLLTEAKKPETAQLVADVQAAIKL